MKYFLILILSLCLVVSKGHASIIGKGLFCEMVKGSNVDNRKYPFYFFFRGERSVIQYNIEGYKVLTKTLEYRLQGTNTIFIPHFGNINRETLLAKGLSKRNYANYKCSVYNSEKEVINSINKFIEEGRKKNKI